MRSKLNDLYRLQFIFRDVLDNPNLILNETTSVENCQGWDSVATVQMVLAIENEYNIRFKTDEVARIRSVSDILRFLNPYIT